MMRPRFWQFRIGLGLALGMLGAGAPRAAGAAPLLWSGNPKGGAVRLYTDGERAIGGVRSTTPDGQVDVTLLALYRRDGAEYKGNFSGQLQGGRVTGRWWLSLQRSSRDIVLQIARRDGQRDEVTLPL